MNGNELEVKVVGPENGPAIVVMPSTFGHGYWYMFKALESLFAQYRFIFYDARGSGPFSSKPENPIETMATAAMAEDVEGIRTLFGLDRVNIFSHCQGATSALIYAEKYADKVANLYLAETILPDGVSPEDITAYQGKVVGDLSEHNPTVNYTDSLALLPVIVNPDDPGFPKDNAMAWAAIKTTSKLYFWNAERHQLFVDQMEDPNAPPFSQFAMEWNTRADIAEPPQVAPLLAQIKAQVFLLHGDEDGASPKPYFDLLVDTLNLTEASAVLAHQAGHIIWDDANDVFTKTVTGWFDKLYAENGENDE